MWGALREVQAVRRIEHIHSGGQASVDTVGLVAALAPGIPDQGTCPLGFLRRNAVGKDFTATTADIEREL